MRDAEYAVFEPVVNPTPYFREHHQLFGIKRNESGSPLDVALGGILSPAPDTSVLGRHGGPETVRTIVDPAEAEAERQAGKVVFRIPKMPLRLISQGSAIPKMPLPLISQGSAQAHGAPGEPWGIAAVGADRSGDLRGEGVCVAVLDTGIDAGHPAFAGLVRADNYEDFTGQGFQDNVGHGTHCAGIIFGRPIDGTRIAVAPGITQVLIGKIADTNFDATTLLLPKAITWAVGKGANIISMSVGLDFIGHSQQLEERGFPRNVALAMALNDYRDFTRFFDRLIGTVVSAGAAGSSALVLAACGNESDMDGQGVRVPATLPASAEGVIAVGALVRGLGSALSVAPFSNTGADICGPGVDVLSAKPGGGTATMSGTSQATPHVAGVAALWWQKLRQERGSPPAPSDVRLELLAAARRDRVTAQDDPAAIGRGLAVAPGA